MLQLFASAYDMSLLAILDDQGWAIKISTYCCMFAAILLIISVIKKLIALFSGDTKVNYKSLLIRVFIAIAILTTYSSLYMGIIRFNDTLLLNLSQSISLVGLYQGDTAINDYINPSRKQHELNKVRILLDDPEDVEINIEEEKPKRRTFLEWLNDNLYVGSVVTTLPLDSFISGIVFFIASVIIYFLSIIRGVYLAILFLLGPFLVVLIIDDNLSSYFAGYLMSFANVLLWVWVQFIILLLCEVNMENTVYNANKIITCASNSALIYLLYKSTGFIPDLKRGRAGSDSGFVISSAINTGLRAATEGAKAAVSSAVPGSGSLMNARGVGQVVGKGAKETVDLLRKDPNDPLGVFKGRRR